MSERQGKAAVPEPEPVGAGPAREPAVPGHGRVAYLGPEGTYSHAAVLKFFGPERPCLPLAEIPEVFASVARGESEFGVVPVENSSEGSVTLTLDCFGGTELLICGEVLLRINHYLLIGPGTEPDGIHRIASHHQSLGQCRHWLKQHYPQVERISVSSNGEAAQMAARMPGVAAIAGRTAAELYGLRVVAEHIEDAHDNTTRFAVLSRDRRPAPSGRDKTSIVISAHNEPGTLFRALEPFHRFGVSLTKLESRPSRREAWSYSFFADIEGHAEDPPVAAALAELKRLALEVKILGSYPAASEDSCAASPAPNGDRPAFQGLSPSAMGTDPEGQVRPQFAEAAPPAMGTDPEGRVRPPRSRAPLFGKTVIIGLGLIGGSIARALAGRRLCSELWAMDEREAVLEAARGEGVISGGGADPAAACAGAELLVLAVPGLSIAPVLRRLAEYLPADCVITDVASVKSSTVAAAREVFGEVPANFVPGHPIAGSEQSGYAASRATLFEGKKVILTPLPNTAWEAETRVRRLWQALGAEILSMDVDHHDEVLAATSHLPHLLAFALVDTLSQQGEREEIFRYAAGGFRDFTRIASSDPQMWRDVFVANNEAVIRILDKYFADLARLRVALEARDGDYFLRAFRRAKTSRDRFMSVNSSQSPSPASSAAPAEAHDLVFVAEPGGRLQGDFRVPGDKSISHRSIILGSLAEGTTEVEGFLEGEDSLATLKAFRDMGVRIEGPQQGRVRIHGAGLHGLAEPPGPLYLGNSGTSMRLLAGLMAAQDFPSVLTGDASLSQRPMKRVADPLRAMGADIRLREGGLAPVELHPAKLRPIHYDMPVASAQVKSCLLLASLYVEGTSTVTEPAPCRDHTERMLRGFGWPVESRGNRVSISGGGRLSACHIDVPADISSAAFFMVGASISPGSDILLRHVGINPTRTGVINILRAMGADITLQDEREAGGEPVADIRVRHAALKGIEIPVEQVPLAIDEFPALFVAAACASGTTVLRGAEELRVKESDRIQAMADGLATLGVKVEVTPDGLIIEGGAMGGGEIDSRGDHRIAMSFVMAALRAGAPIRILDCNNVATSFPGFAELAAACGVHLRTERAAD